MNAAGSGRATLLGVSDAARWRSCSAQHTRAGSPGWSYGVSARFSQPADWPWGEAPEQVAYLAELDAGGGDGALLKLFAPTEAADETARRSWGRTQRAGAQPGDDVGCG